MNRYQQLMTRIENGETIMIDGATGSELVKRGVEMTKAAWIGHGSLSHPDILRQIHCDYMNLGAEIVIANTFATARHILQDAGLEEQFKEINRRAVELVLEARDATGKGEVLAAAGVSNWSFTDKAPSLDQLRQYIEDQVAIFVKAGAELLMLEMMVDVERMLVTLDAARTSGLPVWVGFSTKVDDEGVVRLWDGPTLREGLDALKDKGVPLISIMHSEVPYIDPSLAVIAASEWDGPIGVYAHQVGWRSGKVLPPADYATRAEGWIEQGVQVIGSCCGFGVDYIEVLSERLGKQGN